MGRAASKNEGGEHPKNPTEDDVLPLPYKIRESKRDCVIG
jgi:hypothetical protein